MNDCQQVEKNYKYFVAFVICDSDGNQGRETIRTIVDLPRPILTNEDLTKTEEAIVRAFNQRVGAVVVSEVAIVNLVEMRNHE